MSIYMVNFLFISLVYFIRKRISTTKYNSHVTACIYQGCGITDLRSVWIHLG